jgi:fermentation-respiration switch protein FrsA (DUF1100 family)
MTANLLAHAPHLFAAGVAQAGAYNRTLTPFGFQAEERTLWQAPDTYMKMSPFMHADRISKPLLLIHGEEDNNAGCFPLQSERFFAALKVSMRLCALRFALCAQMWRVALTDRFCVCVGAWCGVPACAAAARVARIPRI